MIKNNKITISFAFILFSIAALFGYAYYFSGLRGESSKWCVSMYKFPIVVIESDDWGATRLFANINDLYKYKNNLSKAWLVKHESLVYGTLESSDDMKMLFHILKIHSGIDGVNPVFTTNYVVANPDYEKIKNNLYKKFEFNKFPIVPKRWERGELLNTVINGMNEGIWQPEYHGLVHIDPNAWLDLLIHNDNNTIKLFQVESYGGINSRNSEYNISQSKHVQTDIIRTGINIFNETFQYSPVSSISPYYRWDSRTEDILSKEGIKIIQAKNRQGGNDTVHDKLFGNILKFFNIKDTYHNKLIINGDRNVKYDLVYLNRNIDFEPQEYTNKDKIIINTINNITEKWNKNEVPIISSHRYNYVGFDSKACKENLFLLDRLLTEIENANPKVIYLTDMELGQVYQRGYSIRKFKNNIVIRNISEGKKYIAINLDGYAKIKNIHIYTLSENAACNIYSNNNYIEISEDTICKVIYE